MTALEQEQHILLIDEGDQQRSITLDAATYSIGRDHKNAIVLPMQAISREHALLLRVPIPQSSSYRYRLVDGNAEGRRSLNGFQVNGKRCRDHDLEKGDVIMFGGVVKAAYLIVHMSQEAFQELFQGDAIDFQSIKQATTNPAATLVDIAFDPKTDEVTPTAPINSVDSQTHLALSQIIRNTPPSMHPKALDTSPEKLDEGAACDQAPTTVFGKK